MTQPVTPANALETQPHGWTVDASDLGIPPGAWPRFIPTTVGNGMDFVISRIDGHSATYFQSCGICMLTVFND